MRQSILLDDSIRPVYFSSVLLRIDAQQEGETYAVCMFFSIFRVKDRTMLVFLFSAPSRMRHNKMNIKKVKQQGRQTERRRVLLIHHRHYHLPRRRRTKHKRKCKARKQPPVGCRTHISLSRALRFADVSLSTRAKKVYLGRTSLLLLLLLLQEMQSSASASIGSRRIEWQKHIKVMAWQE